MGFYVDDLQFLSSIATIATFALHALPCFYVIQFKCMLFCLTEWSRRLLLEDGAGDGFGFGFVRFPC